MNVIQFLEKGKFTSLSKYCLVLEGRWRHAKLWAARKCLGAFHQRYFFSDLCLLVWLRIAPFYTFCNQTLLIWLTRQIIFPRLCHYISWRDPLWENGTEWLQRRSGLFGDWIIAIYSWCSVTMDLINQVQDRRRREEAILPGKSVSLLAVFDPVPCLWRRFSNELPCFSELLYLVAKFLDSSACKSSAKVCRIDAEILSYVIFISRHLPFPLFQVLLEEIRRLKVSAPHRGLPVEARAAVHVGLFTTVCAHDLTEALTRLVFVPAGAGPLWLAGKSPWTDLGRVGE